MEILNFPLAPIFILRTYYFLMLQFTFYYCRVVKNRNYVRADNILTMEHKTRSLARFIKRRKRNKLFKNFSLFLYSFCLLIKPSQQVCGMLIYCKWLHNFNFWRLIAKVLRLTSTLLTFYKNFPQGVTISSGIAKFPCPIPKNVSGFLFPW